MIVALLVVCLFLSLGSQLAASEDVDIRKNITEGKEPCFHYTREENLFQMNCTVLEWREEGYGAGYHISLDANETFDGNGRKGKSDGDFSIIDLSGIDNFKGMFTIREEVSSFASAPLIKNVHIRNGTVARYGGFVVRKDQKHFSVDVCSSTGEIGGARAGGICGRKCGRDNSEMKISNSHSTGVILGEFAGGIAGNQVGRNGGLVNITQCFSTGNIEGSHAGGICGNSAGQEDGQVYITHSYSTGDMLASESGGIVGGNAGHTRGYTQIQECYSTGQVSAYGSGGITGDDAAEWWGIVNIVDCYS